MSTADDFELSAGAYVLGALPTSEDEAFAAHLEQCPRCADEVEQLRALPGLLSRVTLEQLEHLDDVPGGVRVPDTLLPALLREVSRRRRRRRVGLGAVAAAALVAASAGSVAVATRPGPGPSQPMQAVVQAPLRARVDVQQVAWGSRVRIECRYGEQSDAGAGRPYALVVVGTDGSHESIGTWTALPGRSIALTGATSLRGSQIAAVEVQSLTGEALLRLDQPRSG